MASDEPWKDEIEGSIEVPWIMHPEIRAVERDKLYKFVKLVKSMRQAQVEYFKNRTQIALEESKSLERQVDKQISDISKMTSEVQLPLF